MNEPEEEYDGPSPKEIPALIVSTLGGKNVYAEGSWDNWKSRRTTLPTSTLVQFMHWVQSTVRKALYRGWLPSVIGVVP
ncbi:unnamed protein product [Urochloa humidicola]